MHFRCNHLCVLSVVIFAVLSVRNGYSDQAFDKFFADKKYREAVDYADANISPSTRDPLTWSKIGEANVALGMNEKALACFLVSWRLNPKDYNAMLGAARVYNRMQDPENGMAMAQRALAIQFTAEASWEYAQACIALGRAAEAKQAMEKVLQTDSSNVVAARELSNIYFSEGAWSSAIPLLKRSYRKNVSGDLAFQIGKAYTELGVPDSAITYLMNAQLQHGPAIPTALMLGRAYAGRKNYGECAATFRDVPADSLSARDLYDYGVALEKTQGIAAAAPLYRKSAQRYGNTATLPEALRAQEKVARLNIADKAYDEAIRRLLLIVTADPRGTTVADGYFLLSDAYQGGLDTKNAIASLEKVIEINTRNFEAYARLADLYQATGSPEKARKTFEVMMGLSPNDPSIYLALGRYNLKSKRFADALQQFEKSAALKKSAAAQEGIALASYELKDYEKARLSAEIALRDNGKLRDARRVFALVLLQSNNFQVAREHLEKLLQQDPDNVELLASLAKCYEKLALGEPLATIDKKLAALNGFNVESRLRLAQYYETTGNTGEALRYFREVVTIDPKSAFALRRLSIIAGKTGLVNEAVTYIRQYLTLKANDAEAHRDLGDLYYGQKKLDDALAEYRLALKLDPGIKGFYKRYAEIVVAKGEQAEVIKALSGVIAAGSADVSTYMTLGLMYQKNREPASAVEMYQKALGLEPSNFDALTALASCQAISGEVGNAIVSYEQAMMMNPNAVEELRALGDLYSKQLRLEESMKVYRQYLAKDSTDKTLAAKVAAYLYDQSDFGGAGRYYKIAAGVLGPADIIKYAEVCVKTGRSGDVVPLLLPIKADKKIKGDMQREIYKLVAEAYENDSNFDAAAQAYSDFVGLPGVNDPDAAYKQALLIEKKDPLTAQKRYEVNVGRYPADYRNYLRLGLLYSERKELLVKAVALFTKVTELADSIPSVWLDLARIYAKTGNVDEELRAYRRYAETDPQNIEANRRMGTILVRKNQCGEGIVFLEIANTLQPDDIDIMPVLAEGYIKTGRTDEAITLLGKAAVKKKNDPEIKYQLFELYRKSGQKEKALNEIEGLLEIKRENRYLLAYAEVLAIQRKEKEALDVIEEILATDPENIPVLIQKARIQRSMKKFDEAIETYKEISFIQPDHAMAMLERADAHMEQSKPQWAETFYKRAIKADSTLGRAELGLAKLAKLRKDQAGFQEHLENARRLNPDDELIRQEFEKNRR